jgi:hypothetical protein
MKIKNTSGIAIVVGELKTTVLQPGEELELSPDTQEIEIGSAP